VNDSYYEVLDKQERNPLRLFVDLTGPNVQKDKFTKKIETGPDTIKIIKNFMPQKDIDVILPVATGNFKNAPFSLELQSKTNELILKYREKMKNVAEQLFEFELEHDESASPFTDQMFLVSRTPNFITQIHSDNLDPDKSKYQDFSWSGHISNLIYLNDNYDGGELYFPSHNLMIKPEPGMLISFPGNFWNRHGIFPASDYRFAISIFFKIKDFDECLTSKEINE
jgi:hypothetical protein